MMLLIALVAAAVIALIAFSVGKGMTQHDYDKLVSEVEELKSKEKEATIVKRVSQQMEAIAYEQMSISNKQRDRAEEQSRLAEANAARAEEQSRLAQENALRAQQQSLLAERNAEVASRAAEEAREQRDAATYAKSISDTLSFRTLSRSLGTTALSKFENRDHELAKILAYTSWYFADKYKGNPYQNETYQALQTATGAWKVYSMPRRGAVYGVSVLKGGREGCVAVSNYGEVALIETGKMRMLLQDNGYDFRSVWLNEKNIYALSYAGELCVLGFDAGLQTVDLPDGKYFSIVQLDASTLLLVARHLLVWFDINTDRVKSTLLQTKELSTVVKRKNKTLVFYKDGTCSEMDGAGNITPRKSFIKGVVTASLYSESAELLSLGLNNGDIAIFKDDDSHFTTLNGHIAQVTGLAYSNKKIVSSCYDQDMFLWYLPKLKNVNTEKRSEQSAKTPKGTPVEWLVPAKYSPEAWGLSVSVKGDWVWLGLSDGRIVKQCISVANMSRQVYNEIKRGLTPDEWMQYVGTSVEYVKLK